MIRPLRSGHRIVVSLLGPIVVVLMAAALVQRPAPTVGRLPPGLVPPQELGAPLPATGETLAAHLSGDELWLRLDPEATAPAVVVLCVGEEAGAEDPTRDGRLLGGLYPGAWGRFDVPAACRPGRARLVSGADAATLATVDLPPVGEDRS